MTTQSKTLFWVGGTGLFLLLLYGLREVLPPFVLGMAAAYFLDPACDWLERRGLSRTVATTVITILFFILMIAALSLILPTIFQEAAAFLNRLPHYISSLRERFEPLDQQLRLWLAAENAQDLAGQVAGFSDEVLKGAGQVAKRLLSGLGAFLGVLSLLLITPLVTFYLLRDWDRIVEWLDSCLPRAGAADIRRLVREIDAALSGFARGQTIVCLTLGVLYAIGLMAVGLEFGFIIGFCTGLVSFIPYVGMILGFAAGMGVALAQFDSWLPILMVAAVFGAGQVLEGWILTPRLIGGRVGLHPVWVVFALLAGGAVFGFVGVLLAVPVAAVLGVVTRDLLRRYLDSPLYGGLGAGLNGDGHEGGSAPPDRDP